MAARDVTGDDVTDIVAVTGTGVPRVQIFDGATGFSRFVTTGLDPQYKKGIRVALGDVNGDGVADVILGTVQAKGVLANVRILDALTLGEIDSFFASDATFKGGVFVAGGR
jgi:hypothetical protein